MPTIRQLLDRYGQPPREVALDWAWQFRQRLTDAPQTPTGCLLVVDQWTELEVDDNGQLLCSQLDARVAHVALGDLRHWAAPVPSVDRPNKIEPDTDIADDHHPSTDDYAVGRSGTAAALAAGKSLRCRSQSSRRKTSRTGHWTASSKTKICIAAGALLGAGLLVLVCWPHSNATPYEHAATTLSNSTTEDHSTELAEEGLGKGRASQSTAGAEIAPELAQLDSSALLDPTQSIVTDALSDPRSTSTLGQLNIEASLGGLAAPASIDGASNDNASSNSSAGASAADALAASASVGNELASNGQATASPGGPETSGQTASEQASGQPAPEIDALGTVQQAFMKAEKAETVAVANRSQGVLHDTHGDPWVLQRDTMRYRVTLSPKLNIPRQSHWTLALEPIAGLMVQPQKPITISAQGLAIWRIYEADAKPPRACLIVRALHHGRDGTLELVFCGGAEDMPGMSVPLAQRWLNPLTVRVQSQAIALSGALAQLSTSVITRDQVPAVMQRKQAMIGQMLSSARLGAVIPELNRLAELVDGQVTMHAELRLKPDEAPLATWGRIGR